MGSSSLKKNVIEQDVTAVDKSETILAGGKFPGKGVLTENGSPCRTRDHGHGGVVAGIVIVGEAVVSGLEGKVSSSPALTRRQRMSYQEAMLLGKAIPPTWFVTSLSKAVRLRYCKSD